MPTVYSTWLDGERAGNPMTDGNLDRAQADALADGIAAGARMIRVMAEELSPPPGARAGHGHLAIYDYNWETRGWDKVQ
jgi:hypothetical protein